MTERACETCGRIEAVFVVCSAHGAASFGLCDLCAAIGAEPLAVVEGFAALWRGEQGGDPPIHFVSFKDKRYWDCFSSKQVPIEFVDGRSTYDPDEARAWLRELEGASR